MPQQSTAPSPQAAIRDWALRNVHMVVLPACMYTLAAAACGPFFVLHTRETALAAFAAGTGVPVRGLAGRGGQRPTRRELWRSVTGNGFDFPFVYAVEANMVRGLVSTLLNHLFLRDAVNIVRSPVSPSDVVAALNDGDWRRAAKDHLTFTVHSVVGAMLIESFSVPLPSFRSLDLLLALRVFVDANAPVDPDVRRRFSVFFSDGNALDVLRWATRNNDLGIQGLLTSYGACIAAMGAARAVHCVADVAAVWAMQRLHLGAARPDSIAAEKRHLFPPQGVDAATQRRQLGWRVVYVLRDMARHQTLVPLACIHNRMALAAVVLNKPYASGWACVADMWRTGGWRAFCAGWAHAQAAASGIEALTGPTAVALLQRWGLFVRRKLGLRDA